MRIDVVSIFPEYLAPLDLSLVGKARTAGLLDLRVHDLRDWTTDRHRTVDDTPFGGGAGMVMRPDVWGTRAGRRPRRGRAPAGADAVGGAVHAAHRRGARRRAAPGRWRAGGTRASTPASPSTTGRARRPRHRVLDRRLRAQRRRGGRARRGRGRRAAAARVWSGNPESLVEESHGAAGLLEYPVYTKPPTWAGLDVPDVLLSGHHARIARWRRDTALRAHRGTSAGPDRGADARRRSTRHDLRAAGAGCGWTPVRRAASSRARLPDGLGRVADLSVGARRSRLCHRGDESRPPGLAPDAPDHQTKDAGPALHRAAVTPSTTFLTCGRAGK